MSMAKQGAKTATPRLRFPEFRGAEGWPVSLLGSTATFEKGRGVSKAEVDPNGERFCIRYGELYTRYGEVIRQVFSKTNAAESTLFFSRKNDVIVPASGETKEDIATASCVLRDGIALGGDLNVIRSPHNGVFLSYLLNGSKRRELAKVAQGDTVVHLYPRQLALLPVALPEPSEQKKIADCLTSLDEVIAAQGRKVEALKAHKRGLMQQLFPREGETRPRLRFPEFRDAPEWEQHRLGDIASISKGKGISKADIAAEGRTPCIRYGELYTVYGEVIDRPLSRTDVPAAELVLSQAGDVLVPASGETKEDIATSAVVLGAGVALGGDLNIIRLDADGRFFSYYLNGAKRRALAKVAQGDTVVHLYPRQLEQLDVAIPVDKAEQQRIADCLSSLDTRITAETRQLAALKTHKQGLMQQLFPAPEAD
jgi:type I restriction enzyme S subunit